MAGCSFGVSSSSVKLQVGGLNEAARPNDTCVSEASALKQFGLLLADHVDKVLRNMSRISVGRSATSL